MVNIRLYKYSSENIALDKALELVTTIQKEGLVEGSNVEHPRIMIPAELSTQFTYMYIDIYHRYYFIDEIEPVRNGICIVTGKSDVLVNFKDGIRALNAIILRTADSRYNDKLYDDSEVLSTLRVDRHKKILNFPVPSGGGFAADDGSATNVPMMLITVGTGEIS